MNKLMSILNLKVNVNLNDDQKLWRYMDLSKLVSMLDKQEIWLAKTDTVKDKHEGRIPDEIKERLSTAYKEFSDNDKSPVRDEEDFEDYLRKNTFISCWHKNTDENMVMWEIYARDINTVAIQTTVGRIKRSVLNDQLRGHSLILQNIAYQQSDEVRGELLYEQYFFRKRRHFEFEKEVRISLDTYSTKNPTKNTPSGYELKTNINELIENILVHPDSEDWFLDAVSSVVKKYSINTSVLRGSYGNKYTHGESNG